jgi:hypothetical protein
MIPMLGEFLFVIMDVLPTWILCITAIKILLLLADMQEIIILKLTTKTQVLCIFRHCKMEGILNFNNK